jgi:hypothetical protein
MTAAPQTKSQTKKLAPSQAHDAVLGHAGAACAPAARSVRGLHPHPQLLACVPALHGLGRGVGRVAPSFQSGVASPLGEVEH